MKRFLLLLLTISLFFSACKEDDQIIPPDPLPDDTEQIISSVFGLIQDVNGSPISDANVNFGLLSTQTDENGIFKIENASVPSNWAQVKVEKAGYFKGSRTFIPEKNQTQFVKIQLLNRVVAGQINSTTGGTVSLNDQIIIDFSPNSIIDENGVQYVGAVTVEAAYIDPSAANIADIMPGTLVGVDEDNEERGLISYGMAGVELIGTAGQKLNIAPGSSASLTLEVPSDKLANAPATIPLWHFDEETGLWEEEGSATLNGNKYTGDVSHFSFWNCDDPYTLITIEGSFTWKGLNPLANYSVQITLLSTGELGYGYTNGAGQLSGTVPVNEPMQLELLDACGNPFYSMPLGPFSANTDFGEVIIVPDDITGQPFVEVMGQLTDCDNNSLSNGYLKVLFDEYEVYIQPDNNGVINAILNICSEPSFDVQAIDLNTLVQGQVNTFTTDEFVNIGVQQACGSQLDEFVQFNLNGDDFLIVGYFYMADSLGQGLNLTAESTEGYITFYSEDSGLGTHPIQYISANEEGTYQGGSSNVTVTITSYPAQVGDLWQGTFTGDFDDSQGTNHLIDGSFKIIRDY